nr:cation:proton antiporter [Candidatus Njordarchaeota archaeon]
MDIVLILSVISMVMIIGFLGNAFFRKTGWADTLFLIAVGVVIGPVLGVFSIDYVLPVLPLVSTFTLLTILFRAGSELNLSDVISRSVRFLLQTILYFTFGMLCIALLLHFFMGWEWIDGLLLGSMISQTGEVFIIPIVKKIDVKSETAAMLTLEATMSSIFNVVFFFALLRIKKSGIVDPQSVLVVVAMEFLMGLTVGAVMGIIWLRIFYVIQNQELTYMATLGYTILGYVLTETIGGSGILATLVIGIIFGNDEVVARKLGMTPPPTFGETKTLLLRFQGEISSMLRTFFFILLGSVLIISQSDLVLSLTYALPVLFTLLLARYLVTTASTWKTPMASERRVIVGMCQLGLTPALLSFVLVQSMLPISRLFSLIIATLIIITNTVSTIVARRVKLTVKTDLYEKVQQ